jgi:maltose alpha-D-glucosyltransferase / alpha-amylase
VLPEFIANQRWYASKDQTVRSARLADSLLWEQRENKWMVALFDVATTSRTTAYFLPLALEWEERGRDVLASSIVAKTREQARVGVMVDAFADDAFCRALVGAIGAGGELATAQGKLRFVPTSAYSTLAGDGAAGLEIRRPYPQSSNTVVTIGDRLLLKGYRRPRNGVNPEFEIGRFLTEVAHFPHCSPVAGALERIAADGTPSALVLLQGYASNQGDAWTYTIEYLVRHFADMRTREGVPQDVHGAYVALVTTLGERTAGLHRALAMPGGGPDFDPEPVGESDITAWKARVREEANETLDLLAKSTENFDDSLREQAKTLLKDARPLFARIDACPVRLRGARKTRYHGDFHLGQVLVQKNDFVIVDFEGEPARGLEDRRRKHSPLRDVAGMVRSFEYARWIALRRAAKGTEDFERLAPLAIAWERAARIAFLAAYDKAVAGAGVCASLDDARGLLDLFVLEKALYELRYELRNRPDWAVIPLQGVIALAR